MNARTLLLVLFLPAALLPSGSLPAAGLLAGCGSELPTRYVIERDLGGFAYRRYQKTIGVELAIEGNQATGHTASYLQRRSGKRVAVATAFVTAYAHARSLAAEVRERLKALEGYRVAVVEQQGAYVLSLDGGPSERWLLWVSGQYLVKLGAPEGEPEVPEALVAAYVDLYPSDLDEHGRARPDAASAGPSLSEQAGAAEQDEERELPHHLRSDAPR